jgi:hypothetical protein
MMLKAAARPLVALLMVAAAAGCAKGPLPGRLIQPGKPSEAVTLNYESSALGSSGKLWTLLPDGERYSGKYVLTPYAPEHHMTSDLVGDRGGRMVCRFRLNEPGVGPDGGGAGQCQISEGGVIDVKF